MENNGGLWSLWLPFPVSKNAYWQPKRVGSFAKQVRSKDAKEYSHAVGEAIAEQLGGVPHDIAIACNVSVEVVLFPNDNRTRDAHNYEVSLHDALTHCGLWADDSLAKINRIEMGRPAGKRACCHVLISEIPDWQPMDLETRAMQFTPPKQYRPPERPILMAPTAAMLRLEAKRRELNHGEGVN